MNFKKIFAELNLNLPVDTFIEYWLKHDLNLNTEILSEISFIKGPKLYVGTNQESIRTKLKPFGQA